MAIEDAIPERIFAFQLTGDGADAIAELQDAIGDHKLSVHVEYLTADDCARIDPMRPAGDGWRFTNNASVWPLSSCPLRDRAHVVVFKREAGTGITQSINDYRGSAQ